VARPAARQMSFADLELLRQGARLEPLLQAICDFLDKQPALVERVRRDLVRGLKQPDHGRRGLTAPQVLRALVLMRVKNWDYRELRERIADGITLRAFTDFYCDEVPKHDAFNRGFNVSGSPPPPCSARDLTGTMWPTFEMWSRIYG
jgi:IS5 family transposase